jgi:phospholipase/carboxylesterase
LSPSNPHLATPTLLFGAPVQSPRAVVILLHGRSQSPADMDQQIVRRIDLPDVAYLAPAAAGHTWYPAPFMRPVEDNEPNLGFALARVAALSVDLTARGVPPASQVIMGFSQGACLACEYVYRRRQPVRALIALTGGLIGPPELEWAPNDDGGGAWRGMPLLIAGSDQDPWVPAARMRQTAEVFARGGAAVDLRLHPSAAHEITDAHIAAARERLAAPPVL